MEDLYELRNGAFVRRPRRGWHNREIGCGIVRCPEVSEDWPLPWSPSAREADKKPPNKNKGRKYPPTPPRPADIVKICGAIPNDPYGVRLKSIIVILWRTGMRIGCECLRLTEDDLDEERGTIHIRCGKNGKARTVPMDPWGWREIQPWLEFRKTLPVGPLFCAIDGRRKGLVAVSQHDINKRFRLLEQEVGLRRRFAPHQLRHLWTLEQLRRNVPAHVLMKLLGHANLRVTTIYVQGLDEDEMFDWILTREPPVMDVPRLIAV